MWKCLLFVFSKLLNIVGKLWLEANSLRNSLDVFPSNEGTISTRIFVIFAVSSSTHESYLLQGQQVISDYLLQERMWLWINASNLASETLLAWFLWAPVMADKSPIFPSLSDGKLLHWRLMTSCRSRFCVSAPFTPWDAIFERESWGRWFPSNYYPNGYFQTCTVWKFHPVSIQQMRGYKLSHMSSQTTTGCRGFFAPIFTVVAIIGPIAKKSPKKRYVSKFMMMGQLAKLAVFSLLSENSPF